MSEIPAYTLSDGLVVPAIALGTYNLRGFAGVSSMLSGIEAGYRMLDSAFNYEGPWGRRRAGAGSPARSFASSPSSPAATNATRRRAKPSRNR